MAIFLWSGNAANGYERVPEGEKYRMKKIMIVAALVLAAAAPVLAQQGANSTNGWTNAQRQRAEAAVKRAGYAPGAIAYAQGGSIFINGTKGGEHYLLTVTAQGRVHAGIPSKPFTVDPKTVVTGGRGAGGVSSGD